MGSLSCSEKFIHIQDFGSSKGWIPGTCDAAVLCTLTSCKYCSSCPREQEEYHDVADLCWHAPGFLRIWNYYFLHKRSTFGAFNQHWCCSIPLCPHRLMGGKGGTQGTQSPCWKPSKHSAPSTGNEMCWTHRREHFYSLSTSLCEADGRGTLCHLVVGNPQRTCEVAGLTLCPPPLSLCQQNFPAIHSFCTCTQPFRNCSTPVSRAKPARGLEENSTVLGVGVLVFYPESHLCSWHTLWGSYFPHRSL